MTNLLIVNYDKIIWGLSVLKCLEHDRPEQICYVSELPPSDSHTVCDDDAKTYGSWEIKYCIMWYTVCFRTKRCRHRLLVQMKMATKRATVSWGNCELDEKSDRESLFVFQASYESWFWLVSVPAHISSLWQEDGLGTDPDPPQSLTSPTRAERCQAECQLPSASEWAALQSWSG